MARALTLTAVTKRYRTVTAVDALSLAVDDGEIVALLGPNGAGKTTTIRMIQGILAPDAGTIAFGFDGVRGPCRPALGYLPEERGLYRDQPIGRVLEVFGRLRGMGAGAAREQAAAWLERFGLIDRRKERLEALSKGNQQKVQFASAVLHRPRLAVLDEPFSGLDPVNQDVFVELVRELRAGGMTILLSAHQMDLVERCADRLLILGAGRLLLEGTLDDLRARRAGGTRLRVTLDGAPPAPGPDGVVAAIAPRDDGTFEVRAHDGRSLGELLAVVARWPGVRAVASAAPRLHELYVAVVEGQALENGEGGAAP